MKRFPIHLGPLALLLTVIAICMSTLGVLSISNASADQRLAERYAETVRIRYDLEEQGQNYLREVNNGKAAPEAEKVFRIEDYTLTVSLEERGGSYVPSLWKIRKDWEESSEIGDLWMGG